MKIVSKLCAGLTAIVVGCLLATTSTASASSGSSVQPTRFAAQASAAGLSANQAHTLQARLDGYLAINRGTQIAFNKIKLNGTGQIELGYPGQVPQVFTCYQGDFCGYLLTGYNASGDHFSKSACNSPVNIVTWSGNGSYFNNQTGHVRAKFYSGENATGILVAYSKAAVAKVSPYSWNAVASIVVC